MASGDATPFPIKNQAYRVTFPILDADGDLVTAAGSLDSEVSKDGGTFADCTNEATEVATSSGIYYLDLTATEMNADTVSVIVKSAGGKTTPIVLYPVQLTVPLLGVNVEQWNNTAVPAEHTAGYPIATIKDGTGTGEIDTNAGAVVAVSTVTTLTNLPAITSNWLTAAGIAADAITAAKIADGAIDAATFAAGAINAAAIAADAITDAKVAADVTIASVTGAVGSVTGNVGGNVTGTVGGFTAGAKAEIESEVNDALVVQRLDELVNADSDIDGAAPPTVGSVFHELMTKTAGSFTYDQTTDALEALRDNTGTAGAGLTNIDLPNQTMDITGNITGNLSGSVGSVTGAVGSVSGLTAATVHSDLDDIQARLPAALTANGNMKSSLMEILATALTETSGLIAAAFKQFFNVASPTGTMKQITLVDTVTTLTGHTPQTGDSYAVVNSGVHGNAAIKGYVDDIGAAGAGLTAVPWNAAWDAEVQSEVQDALDAILADSIPADGTRPSLAQGIYMLTQFMVERSVSGTTVTVKKVDGSTTLFTLTINDATTPTSITRAA